MAANLMKTESKLTSAHRHLRLLLAAAAAAAAALVSLPTRRAIVAAAARLIRSITLFCQCPFAFLSSYGMVLPSAAYSKVSIKRPVLLNDLV